jgi:hypothetical protein
MCRCNGDHMANTEIGHPVLKPYDGPNPYEHITEGNGTELGTPRCEASVSKATYLSQELICYM